MATVTSPVSTLGVIGTDGYVPVYQPNARWCWWAITEIYTGAAGNNMYVPKVNDFVMDPTTYTVYIVVSVDPITLLSIMVEKIPPYVPENFTPADILFGVGPGTQADTYRAYLDQSTMPFTLAVDIRLSIAGTRASYCKLFLGSTLDNTGQVVSMIYDNSGNFISQNVPLELVGINEINNYSIKTVSVCNTTVVLPDGEVITAVIYDDQGNVVSKRQLLIENTAFIRSLNVSLKYVTGISLNSPFLSGTVDSTILFPLNLPINALNLTGVVSYSDGSTVTMPVDGTKFSILGLGQYVSTIVGQNIPLVLSYQLGPTEIAYNAVAGNGKYITEPYNIVTTNPDNSYDVKLYAYPEWNGTAIGYTIRWFIVNLDRNIFFDVTPYVVFSALTGVFNPTLYGYLQRKSVQIDLSKVSGSFEPYIFTQLVDINLITTPNGEVTPWTVSFVSGSDMPAYGTGMIANISSLTSFNAINITAGNTVFATWLSQVYGQTYPLINTYNQTTAPVPTHFAIMYAGAETIYPIANWNQQLTIPGMFTQYTNVYIRFINRTVSGDQELSIAGMLINTVS